MGTDKGIIRVAYTVHNELGSGFPEKFTKTLWPSS